MTYPIDPQGSLFHRYRILCAASLALCSVVGPTSIAEEPQAQNSPAWKKHTINERSPFEAVGVADFNGDGKKDVFSGDSWYAAPDWTQHKVRSVPPGTNPQYHEDFADAPLDVNGDGRVDIVTCAYFSRRIAWVENPSDPTKTWVEHDIDTPGSMETSYLLDLYGDKTPVLIPNVGGQVLLYELVSSGPKVEWRTRKLNPKGAGHGVGRRMDGTNSHRIARLSGLFILSSTSVPLALKSSAMTSTGMETPTSFGAWDTTLVCIGSFNRPTPLAIGCGARRTSIRAFPKFTRCIWQISMVMVSRSS